MENPTSPQNPKPNFVIWIAVELATLIIGIGIGLAVGKYSLPFVSPLTSSPTATPTETGDPTANWKTYVNKKYGYQIKYPNDWKSVETDDPGLGDGPLTYTTIVSKTMPLKDSGFINISVDRNRTWNQFKNVAKQKEFQDYKFNGLDAMIFDKSGYDKQIAFNSPANKLIIISYNFAPNDFDKDTIDQILSTFKFTDTKPTVIPAPNKNVTNFYYKLPNGWKTVQDETGSFEVGYDPNTTTTSLTYSPDAISIFIKGNIGGAAMSVHLKNYDGGSRHQFIYKFTSDNQPPQKQDLGSDYNEKEYLYNNKSCLFLRGIYTSQFPNIWGMCDAGSGKAFLITSYVPDYETTLQTIRLIK